MNATLIDEIAQGVTNELVSRGLCVLGDQDKYAEATYAIAKMAVTVCQRPAVTEVETEDVMPIDVSEYLHKEDRHD